MIYIKNLKFILTIGFIACFSSIKAQNLAAFTDYKEYFFTFDKGIRNEAEYMPIKSFQIGGNIIAYIDNTSNLKVYYNGLTTKLSDGIISKYQATDYLVTYTIFQKLTVFDAGKIIQLTKFAETYSTGDSMVAFYENRTNTFKIYYQGLITTVEEGITENPVLNFKMGDNIFAYVNYLNQFKLFYKGQSIIITNLYRNLPYATGKNIAVYHNDNFAFTAFYKGLTFKLETFQPKSFDAGDDLVAYVNVNDEFKIFYNGKAQLINTFEPVFYKVADSLVVYNEAGIFKVFYRGVIYKLENFIPTDFRLDYNTLVYIDQQGRLKTFQGGKTSLITKARVDQFELHRNVVSYKVQNRIYIYYNSKTYNQ